MSTKSEQDALVKKLTAERLEFELRKTAGLITPAEAKAFEARQADEIAQFDETHGLSDVSYAQFREVFDAGMGCQELFKLKNGMHPKDPLKVDANSDLRSVGCFYPGATRKGSDDQS